MLMMGHALIRLKGTLPEQQPFHGSLLLHRHRLRISQPGNAPLCNCLHLCHFHRLLAFAVAHVVIIRSRSCQRGDSTNKNIVINNLHVSRLVDHNYCVSYSTEEGNWMCNTEPNQHEEQQNRTRGQVWAKKRCKFSARWSDRGSP